MKLNKHYKLHLIMLDAG